MSACIFCQIAQRKAPADILYSDDQVVAFRDKYPRAPTHILVIPTKHIASLDEAEPADSLLLGTMLQTARQLARQEHIDRGGYRVVVNTGSHGGQTISHLHLHLLGGRHMNWPPG